jgi:hypothetical protein
LRRSQKKQYIFGKFQEKWSLFRRSQEKRSLFTKSQEKQKWVIPLPWLNATKSMRCLFLETTGMVTLIRRLLLAKQS